MTPALARLYVGPLKALTPPSISALPGPSAIPASALLEPARLAALIDVFGAQYGHGDRRAVVSLWSKYHFSALLVPALAANLLLERDLPLALEQMHVELSSDGCTRRLCLAHEGRSLASLDAFARFDTLLDQHMTPLIVALAAMSGASPRVFWSNAGHYFDYFIGALERHPITRPGVAGPARRLLESRALPDGRRNPLYRPVRYVDIGGGELKRVRRQCCLRYLLDEIDYCGTCPLTCRQARR